jgi:hypothetical protein
MVEFETETLLQPHVTGTSAIMYVHREYTSLGEKIATVIGFLLLTVVLCVLMATYRMTV